MSDRNCTCVAASRRRSSFQSPDLVSSLETGVTRCPDWILRADAPSVAKILHSAPPFRSPAMPGGRARKFPVNVCCHRKHGATAPTAMDVHDGVLRMANFSDSATRRGGERRAAGRHRVSAEHRCIGTTDGDAGSSARQGLD